MSLHGVLSYFREGGRFARFSPAFCKAPIRRGASLLALTTVLALSACGGSGGASQSPDDGAPALADASDSPEARMIFRRKPKPPPETEAPPPPVDTGPPPPVVPLPTGSHPGSYRVANGQIYDEHGNVVQMRGLNMFGFDSDIMIPQYLWEMNWRDQLRQVKELGFNAVRVPFVPDTLNVATPGYFDPRINPDFVGRTPLQILDLWLAEADRLGLYILLDFHSVTRKRLHNTWYTNDGSLTWNGQPYTEDDWVRDLRFVAARYAGLKHLFGIDLYNEPTGEVRWGAGDVAAYRPENDWKRAAERAGSAVIQQNPRLLIFVEGIAGNFDGIEDGLVQTNFGENLRPQSYLPLNLPSDKLVFSPHTYGPDVFSKQTFSHHQFPANLAKDWESLFGFLHPQYPVVIGEFGGRYGTGPHGDKDKKWQDAFVDYLISKNIRGGFYWCYTPNSGDTGGILDDNLRVREDKMKLLRRLWGQ